MIIGLHHFSLIVSSEKSILFYTNLGFQEYMRIRREYDTVVLMKGYGFELEMYIDPTHPLKCVEPIGVRNISFKVDNLEKALVHLGIEGGTIKKDWVGARYTFITDPDGLQIQLHE